MVILNLHPIKNNKLKKHHQKNVLNNQEAEKSNLNWTKLRLLILRALSRKEVFQPHLPVRLPCYDLAPITGLTLGGAFNSNRL
jgi:hypothetical protein